MKYTDYVLTTLGREFLEDETMKPVLKDEYARALDYVESRLDESPVYADKNILTRLSVAGLIKEVD